MLKVTDCIARASSLPWMKWHRVNVTGQARPQPSEIQNVGMGTGQRKQHRRPIRCKSGAGNPGQSDIAAAIGSKEGTDKILHARGHLKDPKVSFVFGKVMSDSENWQP